MRVRFIFAAVLALILGVALSAQAQYGMMGQGPGPGPGPGYQGYDQATAQALFSLQRDYYNKVLPLNGKLQGQYAELYGLLAAKDPEQGKIKKVVSAIADLQGQLLQESVNFSLEASKKTGYPVGLGMGPGMMGGFGMMGPMMMGGWGMGGYGGGYGYGPGMMHGYGGGYGYGPGMMGGYGDRQ